MTSACSGDHDRATSKIANEYSVRSAQTVVYVLLGLKLTPPAVYQGKFEVRVVAKAFTALRELDQERHSARPVAS